MASEYPGKQISRGQIEFVLVHDGVDGNGIEFVYLRTNTSTAPSVVVKPDSYVDSNGHTYLDDDFLPKVSVGGQEYECTDSPVGVDGTNQYEWIAQRVKGAADCDGRRAWLKYEGAMTLWSKWGERGTDGDGVEYVFIRTADESTVPTIVNNNDYTEGGVTHHYTDDDFCPMTSLGRATDDPQGVSEQYLCEWVAMRTKGAPNAQGVREWLPFAVNSEMRLWAKYGLDNDSIVLAPSLLALADDGSAQDWYTNYYTEIQVKKADKILRPLYVDHIKVFNDEDTLIYEATAEEVEIGTSGVYTVEITPVYSDANYPIMFQYVRAISTTDPYGQPRIREGNFLKVTRCTSLAANSGYFRVEVNINHDTSPYETGIIWTNPSPVAGSSSLSYTISHATDTMYGTQATDAVPLTVGSTTKNIFTQGSKTANTVLAAPNGSAGEASFRALVEADIPTLSTSKISGLGTAATRGVATTIGPSITNLVPGSLLYSVLGDSFDSSNTVKNFINSSIATATADYKNNYNVVSDLGLAYNAAHSAIEAALGQTISGADNNDYCFVEIPTSSTDPTQLARIERYKFNGTSWAYEYVLNNSSFTAAQWASINSGITASYVSLISGLNTRVGALESRINWDDYFGIDQQTGAIYVKKIDANTPRDFYSFGAVTAGGQGTGGGGGGGDATMADVWRSLTNNPQLVPSDITDTTLIAIAHIPDLAMSKITGLSTALAGKADASALAGYVPRASSVSDYDVWNDSDFGFSEWNPASQHTPESYGTSLNFKDPGTTWYYRLMFGTSGRISVREGINTTTMSYIGTIAYTSDLSSYLPLTAGSANALTGALWVVGTASERPTIRLRSAVDIPNDLWFGSNGADKFSITSRASDESYKLGFYSIGTGTYTAEVNYSTGVWNFTANPTVNGSNIWHSGNFNPGNYLPLSGGIISGASGTYIPLVINTPATESNINFQIDNVNKMQVGYWANLGCGIYDYTTGSYVYLSSTDGDFYKNGGYKFYHSGNFNPANYLPLSGGTLSRPGDDVLTLERTTSGSIPWLYFKTNGTLNGGFGVNTSNVPNFIYSSNGETKGPYTIWHSGNDGAGSGLDADLLDGYHAGDLAKQHYNITVSAESISDGLIGGKLYAASNWPYSYYAFISAGYGNYKMQFNAVTNEVYFRAGDEYGLGNKTWCRMWHDGNDGTGSGLDADLLDGFHANIVGTAPIIAVNRGDRFGNYHLYTKVGSLPTVSGTSSGESYVILHVYNAINFGYNDPAEWIITASSRDTYNVQAKRIIGRDQISVGYVVNGDRMEIWVCFTEGYMGQSSFKVESSQNFISDFVQTQAEPSGFVAGTKTNVWDSGNSNLFTVPWCCSYLDTYSSYSIRIHGDERYIVHYDSNGNEKFDIGMYCGGTYPRYYVWDVTGQNVAFSICNGKVGINKAEAAYTLDVAGDFHTSGNIYAEGWTHINKRFTIGADLGNWDAYRAEMELITPNGSGPCDLWLGGDGRREWSISARGVNESGVLMFYPAIGGGTIYFYQNGDIFAPGTIHSTTGIFSDGYVTAGTASDIRLKENVNTLDREDAKRIVMGLRPVTFSWNSLAHGLCEKYEGDDIGFIAQEVQLLVPQAIGSIFKDYLRMDSTKFIAPLVSMAQSHERRLEAAEREIVELKRENAELKARLTN